MLAENTWLSNGLVGAYIAQLRRTIGGKQQHRDTGDICLDNCGMQVDRGGTRGGDDSSRNSGDLGEAECEVRGGALIDSHVQAQLHAKFGLGGCDR